MSCVDFMYQFYSPYFPYKTPADDSQKYPSQPLYDTGIPGPGPSNFLEPSHPHTVSHTASHTQHHHSHTAPDKDVLGGDKTGPQPKATHYLASNCVLLTYFQGEAATLVDEHFTRSLGQPSSFTLDKPAPSNKPYVRSVLEYLVRSNSRWTAVVHQC
ncbi:hypothetical protein RRG08_036353 [Elysia crispata]|uniref:Vestigial n=1 Tax=Elysia crispata TaxID=231223 RepID=A0AAE0ZKT7_9GAST|nr:hypothetical protein RRG08_036353 [Elysia crispata]